MSTSRLEKFIYAICSMEVSDLPAPLSRIEILWNCLITGETPDFEPQSRNEQYLMAMLGLYELENLPTPMSRGEKLLYKIAMGETDLSDVPAYLSRYEELLGYLAENGGVGDFEYILQTLNQRLSTLYSTKERPMKQALIKGDTLVNELPRPSLKNTMMNVASQKLNNGYDSGKTLRNLYKEYRNSGGFTIENNVAKLTSNTQILAFDTLEPLANNTKYLIKLEIQKNTASRLTISFRTYTLAHKGNAIHNLNSATGVFNIIATTPADGVIETITFKNEDSVGEIAIPLKCVIIPYQDGMENWDIPYFEGTKTFSATPYVVDGEFKQAVVKGQTLVNIKGEETFELIADNPHHDFLIPLVKKNTDYLIKYDITVSDGVLAVGFLKDDRTWSKNKENQSNTGLFKLNSGEYPNYFRIIGQLGKTITVNNLMLIEYQEGMENWDIPYFEGMQSVQLSEVTTIGKNLFDGKNMFVGYINTEGTVNTDNTENSLSDYIKVEPSTSYAYKCFIENQTAIYGEFAFFDENKKYIDVIYNHHDSNTCIITPDNCHYLRAWNKQYQNNGEIHPNAMLVKTTNLPSTLIYEPYRSNTLTTNEEIIIRSLPNGVCDTFNTLTGVYTQRIGDDIFIGASNEEWTSPSIYNTGDAISFRIKRQTKPAAGTVIPSDIICDKFKIVTPRNAWGNDNYDGEGVSHGIIEGDGIDIRILKSKLSAANIQGFKEWLSKNPIRVQYELKMPITKTINPTITDQDGATQTKLHSFNDGHISVSSQGLLPSAVNYEVPTNNSYYLPDMLTLGAQYTSRGSADCNATIDGKLLALGKNRTFTTPSSVTDKLMVLDAPVDDLMFIKGDQTAKDFEYFEGMKSVEMNSIQVTGKNLWDGKWYKGFSNNGGGGELATLDDLETAYRTDYIKIPKNSDRVYVHRFCEATNYTGTNVHFGFFDKNKQLLTVEEGLSPASWSVPTNAEYVVVHVWNSVPYDFTTLRVNISTAPVNATTYEPYKSTTLTLNEPVTLRKVGDVQDTLDGLTGEVTERVGEVIFDGSDDEYWFSPYVGSNTFCIHTPFENAVRYNRLVCDKFNTSDSDLYGSPKEGVYVNKNRNLQVNILKSRLETLDENGFKIFLSKNPITIQYILAQESIKTVDLTTIDQDGQPTKLKTFNDITHAEINADNIIPSVDVEVATKISETLATIEPQQLDISNTQNELGQTIDEQAENTDATMMATTEIYEQTL